MHEKNVPIGRIEQLLSQWWGMTIAHAIPIFVLLYPFMFGWRLFSDADSQGNNYPANLFLYTVEGFKRGLGFWNALNAHGFPSFIQECIATTPHAYLLNLLLPPLSSYGMFLFLNMTAAAALFSLLLRRYHVSPLAAWFGGFAFIAAMWWNTPWASATTMPPAIASLLFALSFLNTKPKQGIILTTFVLLYSWFAVHWVWLPLLWTVGGCFALYLSIDVWKRERSVRRSPIVLYALALLIATIVAIPKIAPAFFLTHLSFRAGGVNFESAALGGITPFTMLRIAFPFLSIPHIDFGQTLGLTMGLCTFLCALCALKKPTRAVKALALCALLFSLIAIDHSPFYWILQKIPPFSYIRGEGRWFPIASIALATLSAIGLEKMGRGETLALQALLSRILRWFSSCFVLIGGLAWLSFGLLRERTISWMLHLFDTRFFAKTSGLPLDHYHQVIIGYADEILRQFDPTNLPMLLSFLTMIIAALLLHPTCWKRLGKNAAACLALVSVATTTVLLGFMYDSVTSDAFPWTTKTSAYIQTHPGMTFSVFPNFAKFLLFDPKHPTNAESVRYQAEMLVPNRNIRYGVSSIDYFENMLNRRMGRLLAWVGSEQMFGTLQDNLSKERITPEEKIAKMLQRKDILDMLNTRTILSLWSLKHPSLALAISSDDILPLKQRLYVYDNKTVRPFAYFATDIETMATNEDAAFELLKNEAWPNRRSLIECDACAFTKSNGNGDVTMIRQDPTAVDLETNSRSSQWLIVSVNRLPGWIVTVDGQETHSSYANLTFFGIPLDAGTHKVELRFSPVTLLRSSLDWILSGTTDF